LKKTIKIRVARAEDAERVGELARDFSNYLRGLGDNSDVRFDAAAYLRDGFGPKAAFAGLVAECEGKVVGYLLFHPGYDTDRAIRLLHIVDLFVEESSRGKGVGQLLMRAVTEEGRREGSSALVWTVYTRNEMARRFYERFGARLARDLDLMYLEI